MPNIAIAFSDEITRLSRNGYRYQMGGQHQVLAVEVANQESQSSWKDFLLRLKRRGLCGNEFVVSDEQIERRTRAVRIFPNTDSCLRLIRAPCVETHETWPEGTLHPSRGSGQRLFETGPPTRWSSSRSNG